MWLFPYLTIVVMVFIIGVLVLMAFDAEQREAIGLSALSAVVIVTVGVVLHRRRSGNVAEERESTAGHV